MTLIGIAISIIFAAIFWELYLIVQDLKAIHDRIDAVIARLGLHD